MRPTRRPGGRTAGILHAGTAARPPCAPCAGRAFLLHGSSRCALPGTILGAASRLVRAGLRHWRCGVSGDITRFDRAPPGYLPARDEDGSGTIMMSARPDADWGIR